MSLTAGARLGPYEILAPIGAGGMGEVWKARDTRLGRLVAIKRLTVPRPARFEHEARTIAALNHSNICQLYDIGADYMVMEYVDGAPLRGPLPPPEVVRLTLQIVSALAEAHSHGILHRDLKPSNILLTRKGEVKLLDFGLAKLMEEDDETRTLEGRVVGTASYMSPEQARGQILDARSDLFSLGAVVYECLTGRRAFPGTSSVAALLDVVSSEPPAPSTIARDVPPILDAVVRKLLSKDREARYSSAADVMAALSDSGSSAVARPPRSRRLPVLAAVLALLSIAAIAWLARTRLASPQPETRHVVVLPFENLNRQPGLTAFGDGLAEVVTGLLVRPGLFPNGLWVVPSSDARRFGVQTVADAGRTFRGTVAIGGSVQRLSDNGTWVISLFLSQTSPPRLMGSRTIRMQDQNSGELEARLTSALVGLLDVRARPPASATKSPPANFARFVAAQGYLRQYDQGDNLKRAVSELEQITAADPDYVPAQVALSEACFRTYSATRQAEWLAKADQAVRRAAELDADNPDVHIMLGRILRATGQAGPAIHELQAALARRPGDVVALLQLAGAYESDKQFAAAQATYQQAIRLQPSFFPAYTNLGIFYMSQGKWHDAEEPLTIVTELAPGYADGFTTLGSLLYYLSRLDDAQRMFTRSIELKPTATAFSNRCAVEFDKKAMASAAADCRKAVDLQPASPIAWGNLADVLLESGSQEEAKATYRRALEEGNKLLAINPVNPDLLGSMAKFAAKTGRRQLTFDLAAKALSQGTSVRMLYNVGKAYGLVNDCARSTDLLRKAFAKGYPKQEAQRDPDLIRLRVMPFYCSIPPI